MASAEPAVVVDAGNAVPNRTNSDDDAFQFELLQGMSLDPYVAEDTSEGAPTALGSEHLFPSSKPIVSGIGNLQGKPSQRLERRSDILSLLVTAAHTASVHVGTSIPTFDLPTADKAINKEPKNNTHRNHSDDHKPIRSEVFALETPVFVPAAAEPPATAAPVPPGGPCEPVLVTSVSADKTVQQPQPGASPADDLEREAALGSVNQTFSFEMHRSERTEQSADEPVTRAAETDEPRDSHLLPLARLAGQPGSTQQARQGLLPQPAQNDSIPGKTAPADRVARNPEPVVLNAKSRASVEQPGSRTDVSRKVDAANLPQVTAPADDGLGSVIPNVTRDARASAPGTRFDLYELPEHAYTNSKSALTLQVQASGGEHVTVRLSERDGDVHVAIRSADPVTTAHLRHELPTLESGLRSAGWELETAYPEAPPHGAHEGPADWANSDQHQSRREQPFDSNSRQQGNRKPPGAFLIDLAEA